jgi:hypothetical protein
MGAGRSRDEPVVEPRRQGTFAHSAGDALVLDDRAAAPQLVGDAPVAVAREFAGDGFDRGPEGSVGGHRRAVRLRSNEDQRVADPVFLREAIRPTTAPSFA